MGWGGGVGLKDWRNEGNERRERGDLKGFEERKDPKLGECFRI